jgi:hypothetical protein
MASDRHITALKLRQVKHLGSLKDAQRALGRGVCPACSRALQCTYFEPPRSSTWSCPCGFSIEMPRASKLYRRARLEHGDVPRDGERRVGQR